MKINILVTSLMIIGSAANASDSGFNIKPLQQAFSERPLKMVGVVSCSCCLGGTITSGLLCCCGQTVPFGASWAAVTAGIGAGSYISDCFIRSRDKDEGLLDLSPKQPVVRPGMVQQVWNFGKDRFDSPVVEVLASRLGIADFYNVIKEGNAKQD